MDKQASWSSGYINGLPRRTITPESLILFSSSSFKFNWRWRSLSENSHSVLPEVIYSGGVALNIINGSLQKMLQTATFYLLFLRL